jgi:hypothetical protein
LSPGYTIGMSVRQEQYTAFTRLVVDTAPMGDDSLLGVPVQIPCDKGKLTVTLAAESLQTKTVIELRWIFSHWFTEYSGNEIDKEQTTWELWRSSQVLYLPEANGEIDFRHGISLGEEMFGAATGYLARLALVSRSPYFWSQLRSADLYELQGVVFIDVAGRAVELGPRAWRAGVAVRQGTLNIQTAASIAAISFPTYAGFLLTADRRFLEGDVADAVVHLAQGLEVAVYSYVRTNVPALSKTWPFRASECFAPPNDSKHQRKPEIQAVNPAILNSYSSVCELFGARHEWVHEGRRQVRPYDPIHYSYTADDTKFRQLTRDDYYIFRSAVSDALQWLGELPIE